MLLAIFHIPADPAALAHAAAATGLHVADVKHRLAGKLPRILLAGADGALLAAASAALSARGFSSAVIDPDQVPADAQRIVARRLEPGTDALVVIEGVGVETRHVIPASAIALVQRGRRVEIETQTIESKERKLAPGRALLTGGLVLRKTVTTQKTRTHEEHHLFALVQRGDGGKEIVLYEHRLDYRFLGPEMQPASRGNFERSMVRLRALAPGAVLDTRIAQPGFTTHLAGHGVDPVDLGLHLVRLAHERGYRD